MASILDTSDRRYASINGVSDEPLLIIREFKDRYWLDGHVSLECDKAFVVTDVKFNLKFDHDSNCILSVAKKNCTLFTVEQVLEFERNHCDPESYKAPTIVGTSEQAQIMRLQVSLTLVHDAAKGYAARHPELDALTLALLNDLQDYAKTGLKQSSDSTYVDLCSEIDNDFAILSQESRDRLKAMLSKMAGKVMVEEPINCARVVW